MLYNYPSYIRNLRAPGGMLSLHNYTNEGGVNVIIGENSDALFWAKKNVYYGIGSEEKNGPVIVSNSSICAQEKRYLLTDRKGAEKPVWIHMPT